MNHEFDGRKREHAKLIEREEVPIQVRGLGERIMLLQGEELIGIPRHKAKELIRDIELHLNNRSMNE